MKVLFEGGFFDAVGLENICANVDAALSRAKEILAESPGARHSGRWRAED